MKKRVVLILKIAVMLVVVAGIIWQVRKAWKEVGGAHVSIDWRWGAVAVAGFCGSMLTSALVWRWLASRMGRPAAAQEIAGTSAGPAPPAPGSKAGREEGGEAEWRDGLPTLPLLGAYTFSQMGKYFPGKVALLLMRIERVNRFGMRASVCTLSTLLENALYMISGGLVGMVAILQVAGELREQGRITAQQQGMMWVGVIGAVGVLCAAVFPRVFYGVVNRVMRKMGKAQVPRDRQLSLGVLVLAVVGFMPCWLFGGLAMWASVKCVHGVAVGASLWFAGAYALSVIIGMASLLPGGLVVREAILGAAVTMELAGMGMGRSRAVVLAAVAVGLQRVFQIAVEVGLGVIGMGVSATARPNRAGRNLPSVQAPRVGRE